MSVRPDAALLDQRLEQLLEADLAERERLLSEIDEPSASLLRRMLAVASDNQTTTLSGMQAPWLQCSGDIAPPPIPGLRFIAEIGRGGMAVVYAAERDVHGVAEPVAVKLLAGAVQNELEEHRFLNEQRILAELKHPNIATLLDVGICDGRAYMVMERIDGVPIDQARSISQVGIESLLDAVLQVADALQAAHARLVIHRDIKPGNVLVDAHGQVKLIDFGIAKRLVDQPFVTKDTLTGTMPLTLRYASPEQLMGKAVGVGSDIYQLGLLCYVLLTGLWPYPDEGEGSFPSQRLQSQGGPELASRRVREPRLRRLLEGDLDSILLKCLSFAPADRYRSMDEFSEDIRRYRERQPVAPGGRPAGIWRNGSSLGIDWWSPPCWRRWH
ncbi:MAG: serine/threonine protein kinase [Ahniella sp.]|nr:serine/threonine protein kinase [Ahniella sp.]